MAIKFNVEPYYDDFESATTVDGLSPKEKYHQVLFRPGHAVQARELTQLQSILQNQVTQFGNHVFKEGAMVIPGYASYENNFSYVKVENITSTDTEAMVGRIFQGDTSGVKAKVVHATAEGDDPFTLFVSYIDSDGNSVSASFTQNESLTEVVSSGTAITADVLDEADATGYGAAAFIQEGIYFIRGRFVTVKSDLIILSKYTNNVSYDIGLEVTETVQTSAGDTSLNDNATGTPNETAPGAHRYQIKTDLVAQDIDGSTYSNFVLVVRVKDGQVVQKVRATDYSVIEDTLARRTFDESGNYTVRPFPASVKNHTGGDSTKLTLSVEPSKAYVRGYEIETLATEEVDLDRAREFAIYKDSSVPVRVGNYIDIQNVEGAPNLETLDSVEIHDVAKGSQGAGSIIGTCRIRSFTRVNTSTYRCYLFDIQMLQGNAFSAARSFKQAGTPEFVSDIVLQGGLAVISDPQNNSLVYKLPFDRVKDLTDGTSFSFEYDVITSNFTGGIVSEDPANPGTGVVTFTVADTTVDEFNPYDDNTFILVDTADGSIINISSSQHDFTGSVEATHQVTVSGLTATSGNYKLVASVHKTATQGTKALTESITSIPSASFTGNDSLGEADVIEIVSVGLGDTVDNGGTDVTEYFYLDKGQTDNYYGIGRAVLRPGTNFTASDDVFVTFKYFRHTTPNKDFFSVDSYNLAEIEYANIPSNSSIELRSAIDFRPRVADNGSGFSGTGGRINNFPQPNSIFRTHISYYLNRIDKFYIDKDGYFGVTKGVSAINPEKPEDPKDSMVLYEVFVPAYTVSPEEVSLTILDNNRYTMRDIGKIEKRVNNLEYYTSLSLLEREAEGAQILDGVTASPRFKNGFIVDSFATHSVANVLNTDYRASIDRQNKTLRPLFNQDNVRLVYDEDNSTTQRTGAMVTLPYSEAVLAYQSKGTGTINVNPYDVFEWTGSIEMSPSSDEWIDTTRRPDLVVDQEGVYDAMMAIIDETDAVGTNWNSWTTNWTGSTSSTSTTRSGRALITTTTTKTTKKQSRKGIETYVVPDTIETNIGDRVVEINFAPFMRSRIVTFKATRLKPNTRVYPFFDGSDVSAFCISTDSFIKFEEGAGDIINGQLVAINGKNTITAHPNRNVGVNDALITDATGTVTGSFFVPNNDSTFFRTGTRNFRLTDSNTNDLNDVGTSAETTYSARGLLETKENVTISTRVPTLERKEVTDNRVVKTTSKRTTVRWFDPLAQSFVVDLEGGAFLTSIDMFFESKDSNIPVTLQIREMDQGIPTQNIIPFSEVTLNASDVNVSTAEDTTPNPTKFTFSSPVYLQDNQEYCFVLLANSTEYKVWYSEIGGTDYLTGERISKQPYAGVLFKSQNASTWTPDQNKDLKFRLNRAQFTSTSASVILEAADPTRRKLSKNPFKTTSGSSDVVVSHKNHGLFEGDAVEFLASTDVNGIPAATINRKHYITNVEPNRYTIDVSIDEDGNAISSPDTATGTGVDGGTEVTATENKIMDVVYPLVQNLNFPGSNSTWLVDSTVGGNLMAGTASYNPANTTSVIVNSNLYFDTPALIASSTMRAERMANNSSFTLTGNLVTTKDNLSPVIDLERCSLITVRNLIDNPTNVTGLSNFNYVEDYVDETASIGGSALAKYITKNIVLADSSSTLKVFIDTNRPSSSYIDLYYKVADTEEGFDALDWVSYDASSNDTVNVPFEDNPDNYNEVEYTIDDIDSFSVFAIKIVLRSQSTTRVPTVKDFRAIALA
jgi:hypothetical protein